MILARYYVFARTKSERYMRCALCVIQIIASCRVLSVRMAHAVTYSSTLQFNRAYDDTPARARKETWNHSPSPPSLHAPDPALSQSSSVARGTKSWLVFSSPEYPTPRRPAPRTRLGLSQDSTVHNGAACAHPFTAMDHRPALGLMFYTPSPLRRPPNSYNPGPLCQYHAQLHNP